MGLLEPPPGFREGISLRSIPTNWAAIKGIDDRAGIDWEAKWDYLVRIYRAPMLKYVERFLKRGVPDHYDPADAEDCVDGFMLGCVKGPVLSTADPRIAPFRAFLQDRLKKHALKYVRAMRAQKRRPAGGRRLLSVEAVSDVGEEPAAPEESSDFDRDWVEALYADALGRLRAVPRRARYAEIVDALRRGVELPDVTASDRNRARAAFAIAFREALQDTLPHRAFEEEEWRALSRYLP